MPERRTSRIKSLALTLNPEYASGAEAVVASFRCNRCNITWTVTNYAPPNTASRLGVASRDEVKRNSQQTVVNLHFLGVSCGGDVVEVVS